MKSSKIFITSLLAAAAMGTSAYATSLTDATLFIDSFDTETINSITDLGWTLSGISESESGVFTSTGTQATISAGTSGASLTTPKSSRYEYSAIFTVNASVFSSSNSNAVLLAGTNSGTTGAALKNGGLAGAWENAVWGNDTKNTPIANMSSYAVNGLITIGISFEDGGTNLYVYGKDGKTTYGDLKGSGNITSIGLAKTLAGVQYSNLYWFNSKLETPDMTSAMSIVATGTDTSSTSYFWAGTGSNDAWNTTLTNTNWTLSGNASAFVNGGNVYFGSDAALAKTVAIDSAVRAGTISVADNYTFAVGTDGSLAATSIAVAMGKTATVNLAAAKTLATNITSGVVKKTGASALTYSGTISSGATLEIAEGGTISVGANGTGTLTGANVFSGTLNNGGTLNISGGVTNVTGSQKLNGNVIVASGATLYSATTDAVTWGAPAASQILNVLGTLHLDARWSMGSGKKIVLSGGTVTGTGGPNGSVTNVALDYYESGVIAVEADSTGSSIAANIAVRTGYGLTFETNADLAVSGSLKVYDPNSKTATGSMSITKTGAGTLTLSGSNTQASTTISAGKLVAASAGALGSGAVTVSGDGSILDFAVSGGTFTQGTNQALTTTGAGKIIVSAGTLALTGAVNLSNAIEVANGASVTTTSDVEFALSGLTGTANVDGSTTFRLFTLENGAALTWGSLNAANLNFTGTDFSARGASATFNANGTMTFTEGVAGNIVWNGTSGNSTWNYSATNTNWKIGENDTAFQNKDNVTFGAGDAFKTVTLVNGTTYRVGNVTVEGSSAYTFSLASGTATISGETLSVERGSTLTVGASDLRTVALDFDDISLSGKIIYKNGASTWNKLTFASANAELNIEDLTVTTGLTISTMQMDAAGLLTANWGGRVAISALTGAGDLTIRKPQTEAITYDIGSLASYTGTLSLEGSGQELTVLLTGNNTGFTSNVKVSAGILGVNNSNALGSGTLTLNGGTLREDLGALSFSNAINVTAASGINTQGYTMTLTGPVSGTGTLTKSGSGTLILATGFGGTGDTRWTDGNLVVSAGMLQWGEGSTGAASQGNLKALGENITVSAGANLKLWLWTESKVNTSTADKVAITSKIILNGTDSSTATLSTEDGSYYLTGGIQIGDGTNAGNGTFTAKWVKGHVIGSLSGAGTFTINEAAVNNTGTAVFSIAGDGGFSGTVNFNYLSENANNTSRGAELHLLTENALKNATVNLTSSVAGKTATLSLDAGTVNIKGLTGPTAGRVVAATAGNTLAIATETGVTNTFSGTVGTSTSAVGLSVSGSGTQTLAGTNYLGTVSVSGGTLSISGTTNIAGTVNVTAGSLDLSGATVSIGSSIQNSGTVTVSSTTTFELGTMSLSSSRDENGNYAVISGGIITDWNTLTANRFTFNGSELTDGSFGRYSGLTVGENGKITFTQTAADLVWSNASGNNTWDTETSGNWTNGATSGDTFVSYDNVEFNTDATVAVASEGVTADIVKISSGTVSFSGGTITALGGVSVTGGTLSVGATNTALGTNTITLSGGTLAATATGTLANAVNVSAASTVSVFSSGDPAYTLTLSGAVSGTGTLTKTGSGTLVLSGNTLSLSDLVVSEGTVQVRSDATSGKNKELTKVSIAGTGAIDFYGTAGATEATTIDELVVSGTTAKVGMSNWQGWTKIDKLSLAGTETSATLNLQSSHDTTLTAIYELGSETVSDAGNFAGTINVSQYQGSSKSNRSVSVVLSNGDIAKNAVVNLASATSTTANLSLGVNANRVTIAGLVSTLGDKAGVYSGRVGAGADGASIPASDSTTRTLVIDTAEGGDYSFNGKILANLNLEKTGAGTQTLAGASTAFNGSVTISQGVLALANATAVGTGNTVRISGGKLKIGNGDTAVRLAQTNIEIVLGAAYAKTDSAADAMKAAILGSSTTAKSSLASGAVTITVEAADAVALAAATEQTQKMYQIFDLSTISLDGTTVTFELGESLKNQGYTGYDFDANTGTLILTVPEPSAFGLLAGAGALALVAARRRRRKKA